LSGLLSGVRVIEAGSLLNVDTVGMLLGDLGADVIKIEQPGSGDYLRHILGQLAPATSPAHVQFNRNKRSVTVDLGREAGREVFLRILQSADVFIDGNMPAMSRDLRIDYETQRAYKPDIIYCHCTGYGATGPYASIPTHGMMMNALVGCCPMEDKDGLMRPAEHAGLGGREGGGAGPTAAAPYAAFHIAAALVRRAHTGRGCYIDVAGSDAVVMGVLNSAVMDLNEHRLQSWAGVAPLENGEWKGAKYQFYRTRDGKVALFACAEPRFWERFCRGVGRQDLMLRTGRRATEHVDFGEDSPELRRELQAIVSSRDLSEWTAFAAKHKVPIGPAPLSVLDARDDAHLRTREIFVEGTHPDAGEFTYIGSPARVDNEKFSVHLPAPRLGEHTYSVLAEVGYTNEEIATMVKDGIV
jgi:crotonobetainyl-CoA:carnitine CoA-transferase CaiB-like acyl-CoA transferase